MLKGSSARLNCLTFSPDGKRLAVGGEHVVRVWDLDTRRLLEVSCGPSRSVYFSADGADLFVQGWKGLHPYCLGDGSYAPDRLPARRRNRNVGCVSADGHAFLHYELDEGYRSDMALYRLADAKLLWEKRFKEGYSTIYNIMAFSRDGRVVAYTNPNGRVYLQDARDGTVLRRIEGPGAWVKAIALSPDAGLVAWCSASHLFLWRIDPLGEIRRHSLGRTHFQSVEFHPSGEFLATANGDGKVDYWDARTGEHRQAFDWGVGKLNGVAFDPTGDRAACCAQSGNVVIWDVDR